jgi:hypothetical protein
MQTYGYTLLQPLQNELLSGFKKFPSYPIAASAYARDKQALKNQIGLNNLTGQEVIEAYDPARKSKFFLAFNRTKLKSKMPHPANMHKWRSKNDTIQVRLVEVPTLNPTVNLFISDIKGTKRHKTQEFVSFIKQAQEMGVISKEAAMASDKSIKQRTREFINNSVTSVTNKLKSFIPHRLQQSSS